MKVTQQDILIYIHERLSQWARWYSYSGDFGLGYPRKSREALLMEGGGLLIYSTARNEPSNKLAEETEALVNELAEQNRKLANAIRESYFGTGDVVRKARRAGLAVSHFKFSVEAAKQWLIGRLSQSKPWLL